MAKKFLPSKYSLYHLSKLKARAIQARNKEIFDKSYFGSIYKNKAECEKC